MRAHTHTHVFFNHQPPDVALISHSNTLRKYEDANLSSCMKINNYKYSFQQTFYTLVTEKVSKVSSSGKIEPLTSGAGEPWIRVAS